MSQKGSSSDNHYDTLGLKQDCSSKDVKDAFVNLSKAHHPDVNPNDPSQNEKFVKIYEAYSVLSRPGKRVVYDSDLRLQERLNVQSNAPHYTTWKDESIWNMRDKSSENFDKNKPYYGVKGVNRVSNYWIAGGAVLVMLLGAVFHYTALKYSATFTVAQLDNRDERFAYQLFTARQTAKRNGNDLQLELLKVKLGWEEVSQTKENGKD